MSTHIPSKYHSFPSFIVCILCSSKNFPESNELRLKVQGDTVYWLGLDNAKIEGQSMSDAAAARDKLKELIESKRASKRKGGPLVRNK